MAQSYALVIIVTIREIVEGGRRFDIPMRLEVLSAAQQAENAHSDRAFLNLPFIPPNVHSKPTHYPALGMEGENHCRSIQWPSTPNCSL
jgi:hypothetical protein